MALLGSTQPQYNMAGGVVQPQSTGIDYQSLLGNPLLHAGIGLLGSTKGTGAQAALQGLMQGQQVRQGFADRAEKEAEAKRMQELAASLPGVYGKDGIQGVGATLLGNPETISQGASLLGSSVGGADPAAVREFQYYQSLPNDAAKEDYLRVKRAQQMFNVGDVQYGVNQLSGGVNQLVDPSTVASTAGQVAAAKAGEGEAAKQAITMSGKAFEQLRPVGESIALLDQADAQLASGASTGPVMDLLPSVSSASLALDNTQKQLGLNVIQNTTFGALSEKELKVAMSTGLPTGLKPADLREWIKDKRAAQVKLKNYLEEAATYLGTPGNTVASFMREKQNASTGGGQSSGIDINAIRAEKARRQQARGQ